MPPSTVINTSNPSTVYNSGDGRSSFDSTRSSSPLNDDTNSLLGAESYRGRRHRRSSSTGSSMSFQPQSQSQEPLKSPQDSSSRSFGAYKRSTSEVESLFSVTSEAPQNVEYGEGRRFLNTSISQSSHLTAPSVSFRNSYRPGSDPNRGDESTLPDFGLNNSHNGSPGSSPEISETETMMGLPKPRLTQNPNTSGFSVASRPVSALLSLPAPTPYDLTIKNLTVSVPKSTTQASLFSQLKSKTQNPLRRKSDTKHHASLSQVDIDLPSYRQKEGADKSKTIIRNVNGVVRSGEVLAIIGGSGSGKTTLLNAIAGRLGGLPISSGLIDITKSIDSTQLPGGLTVPVKKRKGTRKTRAGRSVLGFVRQSDNLLPYLTVLETLSFAAALRLPSHISSEMRELIVIQTIDELGLRDCKNTIVGGGNSGRKGISGGEMRRLSIACVMVALPSILVLDEPTSGLDAFTSHQLLLTLQSLAHRDRSIILTIHAPRSEAFTLFDRLLLLSKGDVVYSGRTDMSINWFAEQGFKLSEGVNPLDWLIDISTIEEREPDSEERVGKLVSTWKAEGQKEVESDDERRNSFDDRAERSRRLSTMSFADEESGNVEGKRPGMFKQTVILLRRANLNVLRNWPVIVGLFAQAVIAGLVMGFSFFMLKEDSPTDIQSLKALCFQAMGAFIYLGQVYWIYQQCASLVQFDQDREDGLYAVVPFVVSEFTSQLLPMSLPALLYAIMLYLMSNMRRDPFVVNFFIFIADAILVQITTVGMAFVAGSVQRSFALASIICSAFSLFCSMSAGFLLTDPPNYVAWIKWLSNFHYSFRILSTSQFHNRTFDCSAPQCTGDAVLNSLNFNPETTIMVWFLALIGIIVAEYTVGALFLQLYHPGGVKHASNVKIKETDDSSFNSSAMEIPRTQVTVEMGDLGLTLVSKGRSRNILSSLSGTFVAGEVTAIVGPSGAGKSTLLQVLAHRKLNPGLNAKFVVDGGILFNGVPGTQEQFDKIGFVAQFDDHHLSGLTVRESLQYSSLLRLPAPMSRKSKLERVEQVIEMLNLQSCSNVMVGGALVKGISGGQKRRLSLAEQLLNDPSILFCDEPTTGLDSFTANSVMECLSKIARTGRTVIVTIHQPRSDIVELIDNFLVLAKGGKAVYFGPTKQLTPYFDSMGLPLPTTYSNPADHVLDMVSVDPREEYAEESTNRVNRLIRSFVVSSAYGRRNGSSVSFTDPFDDPSEESFVSSLKKPSFPDRQRRGSFSSFTDSLRLPRMTTGIDGKRRLTFKAREVRYGSPIVALPVILQRNVKNCWRQKDVFFNRLLQAPFLGLLFLLFYQRITKGPSGAQDRIGVTLENTNTIAFVGLLNGVALFPGDLNLYLQEYHSSAAYSAWVFIVGYTCFELPMQIASSFLYALVMNLGVGLQSKPRIFLEFTATIFALQNFGESIAMIFATNFPQLGIAVALAATVLSVLVQISGMISLSVPNWLAAIAWCSPIKAAGKLQFINEAVGLVFNCDPASVQSGECVAQNGSELLALYKFHDLSTGKLVVITLGAAIGWRVIAFIFLKIKMIRS